VATRLRVRATALLLTLLALPSCSHGPSDRGEREPPGRPGQSAPSRHESQVSVAERGRTGDPGWNAGPTGGQHDIEGFADHDSVTPGTKVRLYVSTVAHRFRVTAYRMGWYGGARARKVWTSQTLDGTRQPDAVVTGEVHTPSAPWKPSLTVDTTGWPPGDYLLRLDAEPKGPHSFVPLTVRTRSARGLLVVVNANTTWQAYNDWGGYSLYHGASGGRADRSRAVSFDRPYAYGQGAGDFIGAELPLLALAEKLGLPLGYATDVDLQRDPHLLGGVRGILSLGHDEYWSKEMRAAVTQARDHGTNIAFFGANALYRKIRFGSTALGPDRLEINYKDDTDPIGATDKSQVTTQWRAEPSNDPESSLTGTFYQCNPVRADMVVVNPGNWLFAGLGLRPGTALPGVVGSEYDRVDIAAPTPHPIEILTHSPVTCGGNADHSDSAYYTTKSGAGVFDAGTSDWIANLDSANPTTRRVLTGVTTHLLRAYAKGPAGREHPAHDNTRVYY
jgi:hypothetical protein